MKFIDADKISRSYRICWENKILLVGIFLLMILASGLITFILDIVRSIAPDTPLRKIVALLKLSANCAISVTYFIVLFGAISAIDKGIKAGRPFFKDILKRKFWRVLLGFIAITVTGIILSLPGILTAIAGFSDRDGAPAIKLIAGGLIFIMVIAMVTAILRLSYIIYYSLFSSHPVKEWFKLSWRITKGRILRIYANILVAVLPGVAIFLVILLISGHMLLGGIIANLALSLLMLPSSVLQYLYFKEFSQGTGTELDNMQGQA